jgi:hypothetical protein
MNLEWIAEDMKNTLGHVSKMTIDGKTVLSPHHAMSSEKATCVTVTSHIVFAIEGCSVYLKMSPSSASCSLIESIHS